MANATLHFPPAEYQRRIGRTRAAMAERALDAVIVSDSNLAWLTGYDGWSFYVRPAPPGHLVRQMIHRMTLSGLNKMIGIAYDMITPAGAENLCAAPRKLVIKP